MTRRLLPPRSVEAVTSVTATSNIYCSPIVGAVPPRSGALRQLRAAEWRPFFIENKPARHAFLSRT
jgi:hypothetical protein